MGKSTFKDKLYEFIAHISWKLFLFGSRMTEKEYLDSIKKDLKENVPKEQLNVVPINVVPKMKFGDEYLIAEQRRYQKMMEKLDERIENQETTKYKVTIDVSYYDVVIVDAIDEEDAEELATEDLELDDLDIHTRVEKYIEKPKKMGEDKALFDLMD